MKTLNIKHKEIDISSLELILIDSNLGLPLRL